MRHLIYILLFFLAVQSGQAQQIRLSRAAVDSLQRLRSMDGGKGALRFVSYREDMGAMYESDSIRRVEFGFCNISDSAVVIEKVTTLCGCTDAEYSNRSVAPGDSGVVSIAFNPKGKAGTVDTDAFVYLRGAADVPVARLVLLGNVIGVDEWDYLPVSMGALRLKRSKLTVSFEGDNSVATERILFANAGIEPIELKAAILPAYVKFCTEPQRLEPGEEGDIVVTIERDAIPKSTDREHICRILLDLPGCRPSKRTIECRIILNNK